MSLMPLFKHIWPISPPAQVATTASYQASLDGFAQAGIRQADAEKLIKRSARLAEQARAGSRTISNDGSQARLGLTGRRPMGRSIEATTACR